MENGKVVVCKDQLYDKVKLNVKIMKCILCGNFLCISVLSVLDSSSLLSLTQSILECFHVKQKQHCVYFFHRYKRCAQKCTTCSRKLNSRYAKGFSYLLPLKAVNTDSFISIQDCNPTEFKHGNM